MLEFMKKIPYSVSLQASEQRSQVSGTTSEARKLSLLVPSENGAQQFIT
jgi:hypothetical protein